MAQTAFGVVSTEAPLKAGDAISPKIHLAWWGRALAAIAWRLGWAPRPPWLERYRIVAVNGSTVYLDRAIELGKATCGSATFMTVDPHGE